MKLVELTATLDGMKPMISRVIHVQTDIRLDQLHLLLQAAFGWENEHLYRFETRTQRWSQPNPDYDNDDIDSARASLQDLIDNVGKDPVIYLYDFGDSWEHVLKIGKEISPQSGQVYPLLVKARRACPPEDIGGVPGYYDFLDALKDPDHPGHEEAKEWCEEGFDPATPPLEALQADVAALAKEWG